jgi:PAS domain S-box-containing protein
MNTIQENKEEVLELLAKGINAGVWEVDLKSRKAWWSDSYYKLLGYQPNEIEAHFGTFLDGLVHPEDRAIIIDATQKHFDQRQPYCLEIRLKTKNGDYMWVETSGSAKWDEHGQPERMAGLIINRHEQITQTEELKLSSQTIQEQNKRLLNFAHIVSHNLRSHSGNLIKVSEILANAEDEEEREEMIDFVGKLSRSLYETVSNLNDIVQIQTDLKIPREELALDKVFSGILGVLSSEIKELDATIITDFSGCPVVEYVPSYLESILLNFTTNALKYAQPGRKPVIKLVSKVKEGKKTLTIRDNGRGIDLEKYGEKLFGIYKTFHGNPDARGIGLFITRNQIEAMGGSIAVESQPGQGTTFTIHF